MDNFERWAVKSGIPWRVIKPPVDDTMEKARTLWPEALKEMPMSEEHKKFLKSKDINCIENISIFEARKLDLLPEYNILNVGIELTEKEKEEFKYHEKK